MLRVSDRNARDAYFINKMNQINIMLAMLAMLTL